MARGGLGIVFKALDENGRWVAIKVPYARHEESAERRFPTESRIAARLSDAGSDAIIKVHFSGHLRVDTNGAAREVPYLDMEYFEGETLEAVVSWLFGAGPPQRRGYFEGLHRLIDGPLLRACSAMELAHGLSIVHRDL